MKKLDDLILEARRQTSNADNTTTVASDSISDEEFIFAANDAQDRLQSLITARYPEEFLTETELDVAVGTESYPINGRLYLNSRIHSVEWSFTGEAKDYILIRPRKIQERYSDTGEPSYYIRRSGSVLLQPIPNRTGKIRINFERELDDLDIRRAKVTGTTGAPLTSIAISEADASITSLQTGDYICISSATGEVKAYNIPVTSATTSAITIPTHTLASGEAITAGDYVTIGKYTTTHSKLVEACERHLVAYMVYRIFMRDDSDKAAQKESEYRSIEEDIVRGFADISRDVQQIVILDSDIL